LYRKDASGGRSGRIGVAATSIIPSELRDGRFLIYTVNDRKTSGDIWCLPWESKPDLAKAAKFQATAADESQGQLSPDGKWIAYASNETGRFEVYVRPFPTGQGMWKVSDDGGLEPRWSVDGKYLYYSNPPESGRRALLRVLVESDARGGLRGAPQTIFEMGIGPGLNQILNIFAYAPHPDGRFLVNVMEPGEPTINVITNWQKISTN
jgi:hypothetical protein